MLPYLAQSFTRYPASALPHTAIATAISAHAMAPRIAGIAQTASGLWRSANMRRMLGQLALFDLLAGLVDLAEQVGAQRLHLSVDPALKLRVLWLATFDSRASSRAYRASSRASYARLPITLSDSAGVWCSPFPLPLPSSLSGLCFVTR